jgi:hypothetical protein
VREEPLVLTVASFDPAPSRLIVTAPHWIETDYYALFLGVGKQESGGLAGDGLDEPWERVERGHPGEVGDVAWVTANT